jgi:hypothetical protein
MDKARKAADQARQSASNQVAAITTPEAKAEMREAANRAGGQVRGAAGHAKRGLVSALDRIDPGLLADVIIKATALQESANRKLRSKGSTYRIGEITITAGLPPQVGFTIERLGDAPEEAATDQMLSSSELESTVAVDEAAPGTSEATLLDLAPAEPSLDVEEDLLATQDGRCLGRAHQRLPPLRESAEGRRRHQVAGDEADERRIGSRARRLRDLAMHARDRKALGRGLEKLEAASGRQGHHGLGHGGSDTGARLRVERLDAIDLMGAKLAELVEQGLQGDRSDIGGGGHHRLQVQDAPRRLGPSPRSTRERDYRPPRSVRPGRAPVCSPRSTTISPPTTTHSMPVGYWRGSS